MPHQSPDVITVYVDAPGVADTQPNPEVGRIWEIGLDGVGYMLGDNPQNPDTLHRALAPSLDAPRLATGDTPFDQAIERYSFATFNDWSAGAGQRWLHREEATSRRFWDSEGVDPFEPGELKLLPAMEQILGASYDTPKMVVVDDRIYVQTGAAELTHSNDGSAWTVLGSISDASGLVTISDLTTDGLNWYAATGRSVIRGTTSSPGADWSTQDAVKVRWAAGRICAAVKGAGSSTPNVFTTLAPDGSEEVTGGHLALDAGHTIVLGEVSNGFFYFGSYSGSVGAVWAWQLGVDEAGNPHVPFVAFEVPRGTIPTTISAVGGSVFVRAHIPDGPNAGQVILYRAVPDQSGALSPFALVDMESVANNENGGFATVGDRLFFSWTGMTSDGFSGVGAVDLVSGGWAKWLSVDTPGQVVGIDVWRGKVVFSVASEGVYAESLDTFETEGWLRTSIVDGGSGLDKLVDSVVVETQTLTTGEEVEVQASIDGGNSYILVGALDTVGARRQTFDLGLKAGSFGIQLTLRGPGTSNPVLSMGQVKYHAFGLTDRVVQVTVRLDDNMAGLNGAPLPIEPGYAAAKARLLESLSQSRVLYQDIDWHLLGITEIVEVVSVDVVRTTIYDPSLGGNRISARATLTLRKVGAGS